MNKLSATFERKVTLLEFDREVQKLLKNFNQNQRLLIEVKIKGNFKCDGHVIRFPDHRTL